MTRNATLEPSASANDMSAQPYAPSWADRLIDSVRRLPGPSWLAYLGLWLGLFLAMNVAKWLDGSQSFGTVELRHAVRVVHGVYFLALIHYLNGQAGAALNTFRPALAVSDTEYDRLHYRLTTLPARGALLASGIGAALAALSVLLNPAPLNPDYATSPLVTALDVGLLIFIFTSLGVLIYHTIHQFTAVSRIHAAATHIDLFQPDPLYAFSGLTARIVVGYILIADFTAVFMREEAADPITAGVLTLMVLLAAVTFVLPLLGMHRRMVEEKQRLEAEANKRMEAAIAELHRRVDTANLQDMTEVYRAISGLEIERDVIAKFSTWPWQAGTLRGLISALLLPVTIWLIQRVLEHLLSSGSP